MKFDITKTPPSSDELIEQREKYTSIIDKIRSRERWANGIAVIFILAFISTLYFISTTTETEAIYVFVIAIIFIFIGAHVALSYLDKNFITEPKAHANEALYNLFELEASYNPSLGIQLIEWCQTDETLKAYQHQIAKMGRPPVIGEYLAAEQWIKSMEFNKVKERDQREASRAYEQLKQPV